MKILLVEDEAAIAAVIKQGLEQEHYEVDVARDGLEGRARATEHLYGLVILDVMLPGMDGFTLCQELRELGIATPVLMLTARDAVRDRVRGLEAGADDYLSKPFDFAELLARVRALLRRDRLHKTRLIHVADLIIDTRTRQVTRNDRQVTLTPREYALIEALAAHEGQVLTREVIQEQVWQDEESSSNTVDVYIAALRKKIDQAQDAKLIQTVHGVGYALRAPTEVRAPGAGRTGQDDGR